jgi:O-antigen ligase
MFAVALLVFFYHGNRSRTLDGPSRYLLSIPILLLLLKAPPRLTYLWSGLIVGIIASAGVSFWQRYGLDLERAEGFTNAIQFGDIAFVMGVLCLAGMFWASTQGQKAQRWRLALLLGVLAGICTLIASQTRGAWIALPPVILLFGIAFLTRQNLKRGIAICIALAVAAGVLFVAVPDNVLMRGYESAMTDVNKYLQTGDATTSVGGRLAVWEAAYVNIPEHPFLGWSRAGYMDKLKSMVAQGKAPQRVVDLDNVHNNFLDTLLYQGIVGLLAHLALYLVPFWYFCKRLRSPDITVQTFAVSGASLLLSFFLFSMTQVIFGHNDGIMFFLVTLVVLWACMREAERA